MGKVGGALLGSSGVVVVRAMGGKIDCSVLLVAAGVVVVGDVVDHAD